MEKGTIKQSLLEKEEEIQKLKERLSDKEGTHDSLYIILIVYSIDCIKLLTDTSGNI